ncbi:MAG TPA: tripartite tricarboxylate transporter TctB family protein [Pseudolabrys sp.]|nr:tripartite tricarboxylate transporter TctB family protein [Pseudolabrys sp.]
MLSRDGITGLVCLGLSVWFLVLTFFLPPAAIVSIGPAFYPRIVLSLLALLSVILIAIDIRAMRTQRSQSATAATAGPAPNYRLVLATFVLFGLYIVLLPGLGFRISTFLFVMALQITLEWPRNLKYWLLVVAVALATTLVCHIVFEDYLSVLLPRGTWSEM